MLDIETILDRAEVLYSSGQYQESESICRDILEQDPRNLEATFLLANNNYAQQNWRESIIQYRKACVLGPKVGFLWVNLALALQETGQFDEAMDAFDMAWKIDGPSARLYYNRGVMLQRCKQMEKARVEFEHALALDPKHIGAWTNLTAVCLATDDIVGAVRCCRHGLYIEPDNVALAGNLATAYGKQFRFEDSLLWYQKLLELIKPEERAEVLGRTANCLSDCWMVDAAISCFDSAIAASDDVTQKQALASTRLFVLHYSPRWTSDVIAREHRAWSKKYFSSDQFRVFCNQPDPNRSVRVAYISPDLRIHAVVFFLQPVLAAHDPTQVTVFCYSDVKKPDVVTLQLQQQHGVIWRDCSGLADDTVLTMLQDDKIDILVDLAGHTALNRLTLFAQRAAPVQITWIGYPNTTGLQQMDYRITDPWVDPPGVTDRLHTEELIRLPDSFLCYRPGADFPDVNGLPSLNNGWITFGSLSNFKKVTKEMLVVWAKILALVPDSRLVFRARGLSEVRFNQEIAPIFIQNKISPERITVLGHARSVVENLQDYYRIDVALDTFPYHGTTTTCESLYMGVPVVTLAGDSHVSRVGCSLLNSVGLKELVAVSAEEYRDIAVSLANDQLKLQQLRTALRSSFLSSCICDNVSFTKHLEQEYRRVWQIWCKSDSIKAGQS